MMPTGEPTRDEILDAFSVEPEADRATLEIYLSKYPEYAEDLIDLSRALSWTVPEEEDTLSASDTARIRSALENIRKINFSANLDPFAAMSTTDLRAAAARLGVPRQVISAFRERRILLSSVPRRFLSGLAESANSTVEKIMAFGSTPRFDLEVSRAYKSDSKPRAIEQISFERLLSDAGVPELDRRELLKDGN
jgi:hypothetical protein